MNDKLQNEIANLISKAGEAGSDAYSFLQTQAPDLCHQIIAVQLFDSILGGVFTLLIAIFVGVIAYKCSLRMKKDADYELGFGIFTIAFFVVAYLMFGCIRDAVKCKVAPKIVVMEYVTNTLKK